MKKIYPLFVLALGLGLIGCAHLWEYQAVDQSLFANASKGALDDLKIPTDKIGTSVVLANVSGVVPDSISKEDPLLSKMLKEKIIEKLRSSNVDVVREGKADMEYVATYEIAGPIGRYRSFFGLKFSKVREFKVKIHTYLYDLKGKKILDSSDASGSFSFEGSAIAPPSHSLF